MGAANALAAFVLWPDLPHRAHRLLTFMALRSLDDASTEGRPPRLYFGGPDALAEAIGFDVSTDAGRKTGHRKVAEDVGKLVKAGAIERVERGHAGHRAVYRLRLDTLPSKTETGGQEQDRNGRAKDAQDGRATHARNGRPYEYVGTTKDNERGEHRVSPVPHQAPDDLTLAAKPDDDDELMHAQKTLDSLTPERWEAAMRWAAEQVGSRASLRDRTIAAARHVVAAA